MLSSSTRGRAAPLALRHTFRNGISNVLTVPQTPPIVIAYPMDGFTPGFTSNGRIRSSCAVDGGMLAPLQLSVTEYESKAARCISSFECQTRKMTEV